MFGGFWWCVVLHRVYLGVVFYGRVGRRGVRTVCILCVFVVGCVRIVVYVVLLCVWWLDGGVVFVVWFVVGLCGRSVVGVWVVGGCFGLRVV